MKNELNLMSVLLVCEAGYIEESNGECLQCGENEYADTATDTCAPCPDNRVSAAGTGSVDGCSKWRHVVYITNLSIWPVSVNQKSTCGWTTAYTCA